MYNMNYDHKAFLILVKILVGSSNDGETDSEEFELRSRKVIMHPDYQSTTDLSNDVCLIKTESISNKAKKLGS